MTGLIQQQTRPKAKAHRLLGSPHLHLRHLILPMLLVFSTLACAQQTPQNLALSATLPDAPEAQTETQTPAASQQLPSPAGSIHGLIVNAEGAVYEGVQITLTQTIPHAATPRSTTSDANGLFQFSYVPPGQFQLIIAAAGFKTQTVSSTLAPGQNFEAPKIVLAFASATTEVEVTASRVEVAEAQLKEEEQQRVFGAIPNFYVVYAPNAAPLNSRQKFRLAWRTSIDPVSFLVAGAFAGIEQATNELSGYGQGAQGYAKRFGASYADDFIGTMIGSAILPSLLHQDPRYFYKGTGTTRSRILYAIANSVICKSDKGSWQPNYSGILGDLAAGGISNLYYPVSNRNGASLIFENLLIGTAGGAAQNLFQEFIVRKLTPKLPTYQSSKP